MKRYFFVFLLAGLLLAIALPLSAQGDTPSTVGYRSDAPQYAQRGHYWIGHTIREIDDGNGRPLRASIWYPALNPDGLDEAITYTVPGLPPTFTFAGRGLSDAEADFSGAPYPLVVLSHGAFGYTPHIAHQAEHLASHGFFAIAVEHEDGAMTGGTMLSAYFSRPVDVSRQIDYATMLTSDDGDWNSLINTELVAVVGFSFGGYTALASAGGRIDLPSYVAWCEENATRLDPVGTCNGIVNNQELLAEFAGLDAVPDGLMPDFSDSRVDAIVPISAAGRFIGAEGIQRVDVPALFLHGTGDTFAIIEPNLYEVYQAMGDTPRGMVLLENADHLFSLFTCDDAPWLIGEGYTFICQDPVWDRERSQDLTHHFMTAFLLAQFYDNRHAARTLEPENVSFPGITYEAIGF